MAGRFRHGLGCGCCTPPEPTCDFNVTGAYTCVRPGVPQSRTFTWDVTFDDGLGNLFHVVRTAVWTPGFNFNGTPTNGWAANTNLGYRLFIACNGAVWLACLTGFTLNYNVFNFNCDPFYAELHDFMSGCFWPSVLAED